MDAITINSTDEELMAAYETHRRNGNGEQAGKDDDTCAEAAEREGWTIMRHIYAGTNQPGTPVLAQTLLGDLWVVNDLDGPWAIQVSDVSAVSNA